MKQVESFYRIYLRHQQDEMITKWKVIFELLFSIFFKMESQKTAYLVTQFLILLLQVVSHYMFPCENFMFRCTSTYIQM